MKASSLNFKTTAPATAGTSPSPATTGPISPATPWRRATIVHNMMPYGVAAKAIFAKANGLSAYYKATGTNRRTDERADTGPAESLALPVGAAS